MGVGWSGGGKVEIEDVSEFDNPTVHGGGIHAQRDGPGRGRDVVDGRGNHEQGTRKRHHREQGEERNHENGETETEGWWEPHRYQERFRRWDGEQTNDRKDESTEKQAAKSTGQTHPTQVRRMGAQMGTAHPEGHLPARNAAA
eukprot:scaffold649_cov347-Pavlova_lutheri.AAC.158